MLLCVRRQWSRVGSFDLVSGFSSNARATGSVVVYAWVLHRPWAMGRQGGRGIGSIGNSSSSRYSSKSKQQYSYASYIHSSTILRSVCGLRYCYCCTRSVSFSSTARVTTAVVPNSPSAASQLKPVFVPNVSDCRYGARRPLAHVQMQNPTHIVTQCAILRSIQGHVSVFIS